jgi:hypothetical protein
MRKALLLVIVATVLLALPVSAIDNVIHRGVDLWKTVDDGSTFISFAQKPIPAGFFCSKSAAFTGRVALRGIPLATGIAGELGSTDTIVERLDDAVFNKKGTASTRIQVRALQLESMVPIKTACGSFKVRVTIDGVQPIRGMQIVREDKYGGRFQAPIAIHSKLSFLPAASVARQPGQTGKRLELSHSVDFVGNPRVPWTFTPGSRGLEKRGAILVDTNFDGLPDTFLPGTSNFAGGWRGGSRNKATSDDCHLPPPEDCGHCVGPVLIGTE